MQNHSTLPQWSQKLLGVNKNIPQLSVLKKGERDMNNLVSYIRQVLNVYLNFIMLMTPQKRHSSLLLTNTHLYHLSVIHSVYLLIISLTPKRLMWLKKFM